MTPSRSSLPGLPDDLIERLRTHRADPEAGHRPRRSAVAAILRGEPRSLDVLLMKRAEHAADPWSGHISLPGGRHEPGDRNLVETALRETREEVGIDLERHAELLCHMRPIQVWAHGKPIDMDVTPCVFRLEEIVEPTIGPEASEAFWLPLAPAAAGEFDGEFVVERDGLTRRLPCWDFEGHRVWGLTHRLLSTMIRLAQ